MTAIVESSPPAHWQPLTWLLSSARELEWQRVRATLLLFTAATAIAFLSQNLEKPVTSALIYVLGVTLIGATQGAMLGLLSAICASLTYNFAIAEPAFVFRLADLDDLVPLLAFNFCALISGVLAGRLRYQAQRAMRSAAELGDLLEVSKNFQSAFSLAHLSDVIISFATERRNLDLALYAYQGSKLTTIVRPDSRLNVERFNVAVENAIKSQAITKSEEGWLIYPLISSNGAIGALLVRRQAGHDDNPSATSIDAFVNMVSLTLERCFLHERLATSKAIERSEAFKTALLSSVSHDMRTPLATISASVTGLLDYNDSLTAETKTQLLIAIKEQCERLNRYTANMLNLSRLQSGIDVDELPIIDLIDVIGGAANSIRARLGARTLRKTFPHSSILVRADPILLEQVYLNILENAVIYSPDGSPIEIAVHVDGQLVKIEIIDQGIGIPSDELDRVFERFHRVELSGAAVPGSGLGLAIAKGFVEAIGGSIKAKSPSAEGQGTCIEILLPLTEALT